MRNTKDYMLDRGIPGEGVANVAAFASTMANAGYKGFVDFEIMSDRLSNIESDIIFERCLTAWDEICHSLSENLIHQYST